MVYKIIFSKGAINDLDNIYSFIGNDSLCYANIFTMQLKKRILKLSDFPFSGKVVGELFSENLRELVFKNHRIIYEIKGNIIVILTILNSSKNLTF